MNSLQNPGIGRSSLHESQRVHFAGSRHIDLISPRTYYTQYDMDKGYTSAWTPPRPRDNPSPTNEERRSPRLHRTKNFSNYPSSTFSISKDLLTTASRSNLYTSNHSSPNQDPKRLESYADQASVKNLARDLRCRATLCADTRISQLAG